MTALHHEAEKKMPWMVTEKAPLNQRTDCICVCVKILLGGPTPGRFYFNCLLKPPESTVIAL